MASVAGRTVQQFHLCGKHGTLSVSNQTEHTTKMTKKIIENIPIFTALIIVIGIIKLTIFYQNFSVPIKYFIGLSEIAITVAGDLLHILFIYAVLKAIQLIFINIKPNFTLFSSTDKLNLFFSLLFVIINIGLLIWGFLEKEYYRKIINSAWIYFFFLLTVMQTKLVKEFFNKNREFSFALYLFALILFYITNMTAREIRSVTNGKYKGTTIVTSDTTYVSNDTSYYIGQTDKYLFLYNTSKHCIILPVSEIKQLDVHIDEKK